MLPVSPAVLPRARRLLVAVVLLAGGLVLGPAPAAHACSCVSRTFAQQLDDAEAVFTGAVDGPATRVAGERRLVYAVRVERVYRGEVAAERLEVDTAAQSSACGLPDLPAGRDVLFLASGQGEDWGVNSCSGTRVVSESVVERVEQRLGEGDPVEPAPAAEPPQSATLTPVTDGDPETFTRVAAPGLAMVIAGLLGLLLVRRLGH